MIYQDVIYVFKKSENKEWGSIQQASIDGAGGGVVVSASVSLGARGFLAACFPDLTDGGRSDGDRDRKPRKTEKPLVARVVVGLSIGRSEGRRLAPAICMHGVVSLDKKFYSALSLSTQAYQWIPREVTL